MIKEKAFDISQGVFSVPIWKIEFFLPHFTVLPVFMKYGTAPKRAVGEKNGCRFRLWNEKVLNVEESKYKLKIEVYFSENKNSLILHLFMMIKI